MTFILISKSKEHELLHDSQIKETKNLRNVRYNTKVTENQTNGVFNFRNTYVGFSWASSSEMVKLSLHETQQIAVEIESDLNVTRHLPSW